MPILIKYYSEFYSTELQLALKTFLPETIIELQSWQFKGNVRELKNIIERVYILVDKKEIDIPDIITFGQTSGKIVDFWNQTIPFKDKKREFETKYLATQMKLNNNNLSKTAEVLGLQVSNLSRKIKELNIKTD